jgi:hypothetical protein
MGVSTLCNKAKSNTKHLVLLRGGNVAGAVQNGHARSHSKISSRQCLRHAETGKEKLCSDSAIVNSSVRKLVGHWGSLCP